MKFRWTHFLLLGKSNKATFRR